MHEEEPFASTHRRSPVSNKVIAAVVGIESVCLVICIVIIAVLLGFVFFDNSTDSSDVSCSSGSPSPSISSSPSAAESFYFLQVSDIHTNLNYTSTTDPIGNFGEDAGTDLLQIVLENMKNLPGDPAFLLITGDFPTHNLPTSDKQITTISSVSSLIKQYFPDTPTFPAMGNNDVFPDYFFPLNTTTEWMNELSDLWGNQLSWLSVDQLSTFNPNGYYIVDSLWTGGPKLVVLNTLMYSVRLISDSNPLGPPTDPDTLPDDPNGQFAWLTSQLDDARAKGQKVILQYHIPSGMNAYDDSLTWHDKFTITFTELCESFADVLLVHLAAHYHTDDFRVFAGPNGVLLNPSVSPIHTNNPGFRQFSVEDGILTNYHQYYIDLVAANVKSKNNEPIQFLKEYDWNTAYGQSRIDGDAIQALANLLSTELEYYMKYLTYEYVFYPWHRGVSLCALAFQEQSDYMDCISQYDDDEN